MDIEVYCDESGLEALSNKDAHLYTAIGGIWVEADRPKDLKDGLNAIKEKHKTHGEFNQP